MNVKIGPLKPGLKLCLFNALVVSAMQAETAAAATFTVNDNTGLAAGSYKIYMAAYAQQMILTAAGDWVSPGDPGSGWTTGSGAILTASVSNDGKVTSVTVVNAGSGYTGSPAITFNSAPDNPGKGATAKASLGPNGTIKKVTVTNPGSGYTTAPTVSIPVGGTVPCTEVKLNASGEHTTIEIPAELDSGRVYFFVTQQGDKFYGNCSPPLGKEGTVGLFRNTNPAAFTYDAAGAVVGPTARQVLGLATMPAWVFAEIGASDSSVTIDASQVDFISFPFNITAQVTSYAPGQPSVRQGIGTSFDARGRVNAQSVIASWDAFVATLGATEKTAYTALKRSIPNTNPQQYVIMNPGGYLGNYLPKTSYLSRAFDPLITGYLWSTNLATTHEPWQGTIDTGGAFISGSHTFPQERFTGVASTISYPGYADSVSAITFTGATTGAVAYIISPASMVQMCASVPQPPGLSCTTPNTTGYQIFAGAGALDAPQATMYQNLLQTNNLPAYNAWESQFGGFDNYRSVAARLGFVISTAFNRGVAGITPLAGTACTPSMPIGQCWNNERLWYPTSPQGHYNNDITQNQFARWAHTAMETTGAVQLYARPLNAVKSSGGALMAMAYGFSNDENPTPPNPNVVSPQVASKYDQNVTLDSSDCNYITFGPWLPNSPNRAPTGSCSNPLPNDAKCLAPRNATIQKKTGTIPPDSNPTAIPADHYPAKTLMCNPGGIKSGSLFWNSNIGNKGLFQWICYVPGAQHPEMPCNSNP